MEEEVSKEVVEKMKKLPDWLKEPTDKDGEGNYIWEVDCFGDKIKIKELVGAKYESAMKLAEKMGWEEVKTLLQRSVVDISASELDEMRGRNYIRLKSSLTYIYGMNDF